MDESEAGPCSLGVWREREELSRRRQAASDDTADIARRTASLERARNATRVTPSRCNALSMKRRKKMEKDVQTTVAVDGVSAVQLPGIQERRVLLDWSIRMRRSDSGRALVVRSAGAAVPVRVPRRARTGAARGQPRRHRQGDRPLRGLPRRQRRRQRDRVPRRSVRPRRAVGSLRGGRLRRVPAGHAAAAWRRTRLPAVPVEPRAQAAHSRHERLGRLPLPEHLDARTPGYVHYFGGDNQRVTLLGQDAGATSIGYHLARNDTPPIRRAILMSGSPFAPQPANAGLRALLNGNALADVLGCGSRRDLPDTATRRRVVECLRKRSAFATVLAADELATSSDLVLFAPSANRDFPWKLAGPVLSEARLKQVDFLVGVARDEGTLHVSELMQAFSLAADQTLTPRRLLSVFLAFLEAYGIQDVDSVLRHYGFDEPSVLDETLGQLFLLELARPMGDFLIYCPTLFFLEKASSVGGRAFFYEFGYSPNYRTWPAWQGVPQFIDFMFATGLLAELDAIKPVSARDMVVARDFARIVAGFAGTGNPNVLPNMLWRRWEPSADGGLVLDYDVDSAYKQGPSFPEKANCDFWRRHFVLTN
ncbi:cholinesterase-like isoform X2 [Dermacentor albipictus]|uniref:cholinesterase-like isoform X2 n=1 Tax=Dermacentor albipictus TaxID=60249 RepID=UPI0031FC0900